MIEVLMLYFTICSFFVFSCSSLEQLKVFVTSMEKGHHHDDKGCGETMETATIHEFNEGKHNCKKCVVNLVKF